LLIFFLSYPSATAAAAAAAAAAGTTYTHTQKQPPTYIWSFSPHLSRPDTKFVAAHPPAL